jgi:hypothetical protein
MSRTLASVILRDLAANRPAAGINGRQFYASDTGAGYRDNGATWDQTGLAKFSAPIVAQTSIALNHNLGTTAVIVQVRDAAGKRAEPETETVTSANVVTLTFGAAFTGTATVIG